MDNRNWEQIETIIDEVLTLPEEKRKSYIDYTCQDDNELKSEVTHLLESIFDSEGWLENPKDYKEDVFQDVNGDKEVAPAHPLIGTKIGAYRIKQKLGEGGMGAVYQAERVDDEFEHTVAIKIIRNEKASAENIRRFEQERTIMAGLNHPGIAKLFDGGITENGFPYFVMEYVDGIPIDHYCTDQDYSISEKIELFKQVLQAVRHAHENLVVHRDLKPGNILVNASGNVKILDFGISKLLQDDQSAGSNITKTNARLLTPKYAAPEQILQSSITTATDIYALGIIFYKLLGGAHPFDLDDLSQFRMEQTILEAVPPKPSSKVSSSNQQKMLLGDLDAIALKAIRKEPEQRYRVANEFLDDLNKFQQGLPVAARDDSVRYRVQKFFSRHKQGATITAGVILLLIGFLGFYSWQITEERNRAQIQSERAEEMTEFLLSLFQANNPRATNGEDFAVSEIINRGLYRLENNSLSAENRALMLAAIGQIQLNIGQIDQAGNTIKQAFQLVTDSVQVQTTSMTDINTVFGNWQRESGNLDSAKVLFQIADSLHLAAGSTQTEEYRINLLNLANIYSQNRQYDKTLNVLDKIGEFPGQDDRTLHNKSYYYNNRAIAYSGLGDQKKALLNYEKSLDIKEEIYDPNNPELALSYHNIAVVYLRQDLSKRAYDLFKKAYQIRKKAFGPDHQLLGSTLSGLGTTANKIGKTAESEKYHKESIRIIKEQLGTKHYRYALALRNYASFLIDMERFSEAERILNTAHTVILEQYGSEHTLNAYITNIKALLYSAWNKPEQAIANYEVTFNLFKESYGPNYPRLSRVLSSYGIFQFKQKGYDKAIALFKDSNKILMANNESESFLFGKNDYYLGRSFLYLNKKDSARNNLENAYQIIKEAKSDTFHLAIDIQNLLTESYK